MKSTDHLHIFLHIYAKVICKVRQYPQGIFHSRTNGRIFQQSIADLHIRLTFSMQERQNGSFQERLHMRSKITTRNYLKITRYFLKITRCGD